MAIQVSEALTQFGYLKRDIDDVDSNVFLQWCKIIHNFTYRYLKKNDPERFITSQSYTITTSPSTQALPATFRDINSNGTGVFDSNGVRLAITSYGSTLRGFYITGSNIVFTGMTDETVTLRFIPTLTQIDSTSDYFTLDTLSTGAEIIPDEFLDYVLQFLDIKYSQWDDDSVSESNADQRANRVLSEMCEDFTKTPKVYAIKDISSSF